MSRTPLRASRGHLLAYRRKHRFGHGALAWHELDGPETLAFTNTSGDGTRTVLCLTNSGYEPASLPDGDVIISSGPLDDGRVPTDITVWLRLPTGHDR